MSKSYHICGCKMGKQRAKLKPTLVYVSNMPDLNSFVPTLKSGLASHSVTYSDDIPSQKTTERMHHLPKQQPRPNGSESSQRKAAAISNTPQATRKTKTPICSPEIQKPRHQTKTTSNMLSNRLSHTALRVQNGLRTSSREKEAVEKGSRRR